jgi:hypothetical protein
VSPPCPFGGGDDEVDVVDPDGAPVVGERRRRESARSDPQTDPPRLGIEGGGHHVFGQRVQRLQRVRIRAGAIHGSSPAQ